MTVSSYPDWAAGYAAGQRSVPPHEDLGGPPSVTLHSGLIAAAIATVWFDVLVSLPLVRGSDNWWLAALPIPAAAILGLFSGGAVMRSGPVAAATCVFMVIGTIVGTLVLSYWFFAVSGDFDVLAPFVGMGVCGWPPVVIVAPSVLTWAWLLRSAQRSDDAARTVRLTCLSVFTIGLGLYIAALAGL